MTDDWAILIVFLLVLVFFYVLMFTSWFEVLWWVGINIFQRRGNNMSPSFDEGYKAYLDDAPRSANPYWFCNAKHNLWDAGWCEAQADAIPESERRRA